MRNVFALFRKMAMAGVGFVALGGTLVAQVFPEGVEGEEYFVPRIDLISEADGGPMTIELDGELDEDYWHKAVWHDPENYVYGTDPEPDEDDFDFLFAAAADDEFLYIAWQITDDILQIDQSTGCNVWQDDSVEIYIDAKGDGPTCVDNNSCYGEDDAQLAVGANQAGLDDPEELVVGGVAGGSTCDFAGPSPEVIQGVVIRNYEEEGDPETYFGWQAEVAIALETLGNNEDLTPTWIIEPEDGVEVGFNIHGIDDDNGDNDNNHRWGWSTAEPSSQSWRNPGVFGKIIFHEPPAPEGASRKPGDVNGDGELNLTDSVALLSFLFAGGPLPQCFVDPDTDRLTEAGFAILDFNGDDVANLTDAVGGLEFLFAGGASPHVLGVDCTVVPGTCESNCPP